MEGKKRGGGSKLSRTETVTVRLDPRSLYLAELAARKQRRTLSSYIEWAVEHSFEAVELEETGYNQPSITIQTRARELWDADESERFLRLAIKFPDLLTYEEQQRWKVIRDSALLLPAKERSRNGVLIWDEAMLEDHVYPAARRQWPSLLAAINDGTDATREWIDRTFTMQADGSLFPRFTPPPPPPPPSPAQNFDLDDEIPF